jgi:hypothetical protein
MAFAIKTGIEDPLAENLVLSCQKTMYGGKRVANNDTIFVFASENEGETTNKVVGISEEAAVFLDGFF